MTIHVLSGTGAPTLTADLGTHYIDTSTGDQYLYGSTAWQKLGGSDQAIGSADLASTATVTLDPAHTDTVLTNAPASGHAILALDALVAMTTVSGWPRRVHFIQPQPIEFSLSGTAPTTQLNFDLSGGFTLAGGVVSPPGSAQGFTVTINSIGTPAGFGAKFYMLQFSAQTASVTLGG